jgi:hypothetical protein
LSAVINSSAEPDPYSLLVKTFHVPSVIVQFLPAQEKDVGLGVGVGVNVGVGVGVGVIAIVEVALAVFPTEFTALTSIR